MKNLKPKRRPQQATPPEIEVLAGISTPSVIPALNWIETPSDRRLLLLEVHQKVYDFLADLTATGLHGKTIYETASILLSDGVRRELSVTALGEKRKPLTRRARRT
jgi:hypothetical protein